MSNSRVESHSRAELRNRIISTATLLEILLSGLVLIGLLLSMVPLLQWMPGLLFDGNDAEVSIFLQRRWTSSSASSSSRCWTWSSPLRRQRDLLYSPELKFYSNKVKMDRTRHQHQGPALPRRLFRLDRGLMMASVMGVLMGRSWLRRKAAETPFCTELR